jgi:hypothetical protein
MSPISELKNAGVRVLLMRRSGEDTVQTSVGWLDSTGKLRGWFAKNPPTHFCAVPPFGSDKAAVIRKKLTGAA